MLQYKADSGHTTLIRMIVFVNGLEQMHLNNLNSVHKLLNKNEHFTGDLF